MRKWMVWLIWVLLVGIAAAQEDGAPLTEPEKAEIVQVAREMEKNPTSEKFNDAQVRLFKRLVEAPNITVTICSTPAFEIGRKNKKVGQALTGLMLFGAAAHVLENPDATPRDQNVVAAEAMVNAYEVLKSRDPKLKDKVGDELLEKKQRGELRKYLEETVSCESEKKG